MIQRGKVAGFKQSSINTLRSFQSNRQTQTASLAVDQLTAHKKNTFYPYLCVSKSRTRGTIPAALDGTSATWTRFTLLLCKQTQKPTHKHTRSNEHTRERVQRGHLKYLRNYEYANDDGGFLVSVASVKSHHQWSVCGNARGSSSRNLNLIFLLRRRRRRIRCRRRRLCACRLRRHRCRFVVIRSRACI